MLRVAAWVLVCCLGVGADSSVRSDDGQVTARLRGEELVVSRAGRTLWRRTTPPGELLAVSPRGLAVVGNSPGFVVRGPELELVDSLPHSLRKAWFDSSESHLYLMGADGQGYVYSLSGDRRLQALTPRQMLEQMDNPHCPGEAVALGVGQRLTPNQLASLKEVEPWTRLALQAFHRQPGAAQRYLRVQLSGSKAWREWLDSAHLGGPELLKEAVSRALLADELGESSPHLDPILVALLARTGQSDVFYSTALNRLTKAPVQLGPRLEELARAGQPGALRYLTENHENQRLVRLLPQYPGELLSYFTRTPCVEAIEPALIWLNGPRYDLRYAVREMLFFQTRVDLGNDPQAWRNWVRQTPQERLQTRLSQGGWGEEARLLLNCGLGRLEATQLAGHMRLVRVLPDRGTMSADGRRVVGSSTVWTLLGAKPEEAQPFTSLFDPDSGLLLGSNARVVSIRRPGFLEPVACWNYSYGYLGSPLRLANHARMVVFEHGLAEAASGKVLWRWPEDRRCSWVSQDGSQLVLLNGGHYELWDYRSHQYLRSLPGTPLASRQKVVLLEQTDRLAWLDGKQPGFGAAEVNALSPDGLWLVQANDHQVTVTRLNDRKTQHLALDVHDISFGADGRSLGWVGPNGVEFRNLEDLSLRAVGGHATATLQGASYDQAGKWACLLGWVTDTMVYELAPVPGKLPPPEHQQLFGELWTGRRLRAGMAVTLTSAEYERRRQQWRELCGREWVQGCAYPEPSRPVPWQLALLLPLPAMLWLWRRKQQAEASSG